MFKDYLHLLSLSSELFSIGLLFLVFRISLQIKISPYSVSVTCGKNSQFEYFYFDYVFGHANILMSSFNCFWVLNLIKERFLY